jgi:hypothetical protein
VGTSRGRARRCLAAGMAGMPRPSHATLLPRANGGCRRSAPARPRRLWTVGYKSERAGGPWAGRRREGAPVEPRSHVCSV